MAAHAQNVHRDPSEGTEAANALIARQLFKNSMHFNGLTQEEVYRLCDQLVVTFNICTSENVQKCKSLIIKYIICHSNMHLAIKTFCKYMTDMATAYHPMQEGFTLLEPMDDKFEQYRGLGVTATGEHVQRPYTSMQRLHMLYVVHDVMATLRGWIRDKTDAPAELHVEHFVGAVKAFKSHVPTLVAFVAARNLFPADNALQRLNKLIRQWEKMAWFDEDELVEVRKVVDTAKDTDHKDLVKQYRQDNQRRFADKTAQPNTSDSAALITSNNEKPDDDPNPIVLPKRHGVKDNPEAPWHMLPAANGLYMKNTRGYPLKAAAFPKGGYEVENGGKEASPDLKKDIKHLHSEMLHCFDDFTAPDSVLDIDPMGNKIWKDPERDQRNYWGFTEEGVKKAKENRKKFRESATGYADVPPLQADPLSAMSDINAAVARAQELAANRAGGDRGRGGRGGWRGGRGGWRGGRGGRGAFY
ncbi:hypothetical protein AC579_7009 [Pseudocercospora musae]|uniref:CID domain-containing protein n=1 Tax=Pseudocercospora musae TaxID=113226 RepID=A0A139HD74_9PEZI|nr:hypothetical protein AC579_7009 [Pseudocercospora musae]KXT00422.1 hypothetical protein AC579_7009 [Pseudocercospora musae]KXT00424.1 hypothetical protein AC579_7009 [Pseudocercospora musae]